MRHALTTRILGIGVSAAALIGVTAAPGHARTDVDKIDVLPRL